MYLFKILLLQVIWISLVYCYKFHIPHYWAFGIISILVLLEKLVFNNSIATSKLILFNTILAIIGLAHETTLHKLGHVNYGNQIPVWIVMMWFVFGHYYPELIKKIKDNETVFACLFGVFAPFTYLTAYKIVGLELNKEGLLFISISWFLFLPISAFLYRKIVLKDS